MLGQPIALPQPIVLGVRMLGALPAGTTATDLVLTLTQLLRARGVVGSFVEFFGDGLSTLPVADRATLSNMCPEYGATSAYFPVDEQTLGYLRFTGRGGRGGPRRALREGAGAVPDGRCARADVQRRGRARPRRRSSPRSPGPSARRIGWRCPTCGTRSSRPSASTWNPTQKATEVGRFVAEGGSVRQERLPGGDESATRWSRPTAWQLRDGSVVIAAITSCTNTSNPSVMLAAGLLAKRAVEAGLESQPWVKTSLAPGSRVVTDYLDRAGLTSVPRQAGVRARRVRLHDVHRQLGSADRRGRGGRRRGRPQRRRGALREPQLRGPGPPAGARVVPRVAAARGRIRAGGTDRPRPDDRTARPEVPTGPVYLRDLWPTPDEIVAAVATRRSRAAQFDERYARIWDGDERWRALETPSGSVYAWDPASTYVQEPPVLRAPRVRTYADVGRRPRARQGG